MKKIDQLAFGFTDAENYRRSENRSLFNKLFLRNHYLEDLLDPSKYFLVGDKGTGKTAYSVFLSNNEYKETRSSLKFLRETEYEKFISLKQQKHLTLSDYGSIWKVIILLLISKGIEKESLDHNYFVKSKKINGILDAIDKYYQYAFSPEIINALRWIENSKLAAEIVVEGLKAAGEEFSGLEFNESRFQVNLLFIQQQFENAIGAMRLTKNHILFLDGIDVRPGQIPYDEYLDCIKGLANAIWSLNNDFFCNIKGSRGRFKVVLLIRPDIFNSLGLQNQANKINDNSVYLDWRTTYPEYRTSNLFSLSDRALAVQQDSEMEMGTSWDFYFPWKSKSTNPKREVDDSFIDFLRLSYSRPRDIFSALLILKGMKRETNYKENDYFASSDLNSNIFLNRYSEYLMSGIKDQLSFYYTQKEYDIFLNYFTYFNGYFEFEYQDCKKAFETFRENIKREPDVNPKFANSFDDFLQFLYETNIVAYTEQTNGEPLFRWCYRERSISNINPKIKHGVKYRIHYGLFKSLNFGYSRLR